MEGKKEKKEKRTKKNDMFVMNFQGFDKKKTFPISFVINILNEIYFIVNSV